jgi:hypothetical protein
MIGWAWNKSNVFTEVMEYKGTKRVNLCAKSFQYKASRCSRGTRNNRAIHFLLCGCAMKFINPRDMLNPLDLEGVDITVRSVLRLLARL